MACRRTRTVDGAGCSNSRPDPLRLRGRLLVLVLVAVVPLGGLLVQAGLERRRQAGEAAYAQALALARVAASAQDRLVEGTRQYLAALPVSPRSAMPTRGAAMRPPASSGLPRPSSRTSPW